MAFNPAAFALNASVANSQLAVLAAASQAAQSSSKPSVSSVSGSAVASTPSSISADMSAEMCRFVSAGGGPMSFSPQFAAFSGMRFDGGLNAPPGLGGPLGLDPAFRAMAPNGLPFGGMYPGLGPDFRSPEMGPGPLPPNGMSGFYYDASLGGYPYGGPLDLNGARRKNATRETTAALKHWLYEHRKNPYPTKGEKIMLAIMTKMTLTQVSTWFANARRRLKKENKMTWSPRNRPGDDDDDDLGDPLDGNDRPSSSLSDASDLAVDGATILKDEPKTDSALADDGNRKRPCSPTPSNASFEGSPSKKPKIWSIADTINNSSTNVTSASEQLPVSAPPTTAATVDGKRSEPPSSADLSPASGLSLSNSTPFAYSFNPWQQQMAAMAAAAAAKQPAFASPGAFNPFGCGSPMLPAGHPMLAAQLRPEMFAAAMNRLPNSVSFFPPGMLLPPSLHAPVSIVSPTTGAASTVSVSAGDAQRPAVTSSSSSTASSRNSGAHTSTTKSESKSRSASPTPTATTTTGAAGEAKSAS